MQTMTIKIRGNKGMYFYFSQINLKNPSSHLHLYLNEKLATFNCYNEKTKQNKKPQK